MCFEYTAQPPELPLEFIGASATGEERLTLTSADGTKFSAYAAHPEAPNGAGIVIMPDVRGLFRFYEELAQRFAVAGVEAIVVDYFGRTAGLAVGRDEQFDFMPHVMQTRPEQVAADVAAAVAYLRAIQGQRPRAIFTVGFCFGGAQSFMQAANSHGLSGVIGFYGPPTANRFGGPTPAERAGAFECPVLGLFGGADQGIPAEAVQQFDAALTQANIEHELITYPGAPHSFFDRRYEDYQQESADAWQRVLTFIGANTPQVQNTLQA